jgi:hypothetical protein
VQLKKKKFNKPENSKNKTSLENKKLKKIKTLEKFKKKTLKSRSLLSKQGNI